jgi:hypothetical protein
VIHRDWRVPAKAEESTKDELLQSLIRNTRDSLQGRHGTRRFKKTVACDEKTIG